MFVTACYATIEGATGEIAYITAGHEPMLWRRRASQKVEQLRIPNLALGLQANTRFAAGRARLQPGDSLFIYTDGLVESENAAGKAFDIDQLASLVQSSAEIPLNEWSAEIFEAVSRHRGNLPQVDDMSLIIVRRVA